MACTDYLNTIQWAYGGTNVHAGSEEFIIPIEASGFCACGAISLHNDIFLVRFTYTRDSVTGLINKLNISAANWSNAGAITVNKGGPCSYILITK